MCVAGLWVGCGWLWTVSQRLWAHRRQPASRQLLTLTLEDHLLLSTSHILADPPHAYEGTFKAVGHDVDRSRLTAQNGDAAGAVCPSPLRPAALVGADSRVLFVCSVL